MCRPLMGIHVLTIQLFYVQGLSKLIGDNAPGAVKTQKFENYFGRKLAIDASMSLYQFLVRPLTGHKHWPMICQHTSSHLISLAGRCWATRRSDALQ